MTAAGRCRWCGEILGEPGHAQRCDGRQGVVEAGLPLLPLFEPREHARTSDPDTSVAAAYAVADATEVQRRVLALHDAHLEGLTDEELVEAYARAYPSEVRSLESRSSPRKRRSDLTKAGIVIDGGWRRALRSGRKGVVWHLAARLNA